MRHKKYFRRTYDEVFLERQESLYVFRQTKSLKNKIIFFEEFVGDLFGQDSIKKGKYKILNTKKLLIINDGFITVEALYVDMESENGEITNILEKTLYKQEIVDFGKHLLVELKRY